jgi:uncharacterized protein YcfJ
MLYSIYRRSIMRTFSTKQWLVIVSTVAVTLAVSSTAAQAQDQGRVISSQPVIQQVAVPRQTCSNEQIAVQGQKSGAGGLMGAVAGGAIGNNIGSGSGRALATVIGVIGGSVMGDRIEGAPPVQMQTVQSCRTVTVYENRTSAYNVVYEFGGRQYSVQMPNDPGQYVQVQVTPVGAGQQPVQNMGIPAPVIQPMVQQPTVQQPVVQQYVAAPQVVYAQPQVVYTQPQVVYQQRPYYPVIYPSIHLGFGFHGGHGHRRWH